jgi:PPK2 family polyphosphate:nucleotide phosphotransferase
MDILKYKVSDGKTFKLTNYKTVPPNDSDEKAELKEQLAQDIVELSKRQEMFFAHEKYSILMIFQAMDAAGKDGAIKHVMSGINPQGCHVVGFKAPSSKEYSHHYLWRHTLALPEKGKIGIHNRSHYEFVLACKVNPHFVLNERIPSIKSVDDLDKKFWKNRYKEIRNFEETLSSNGTIILKFFLHVSKNEQKKRLLERIETLEKNWKFDSSDLKARKQWDDYMQAYQDAIQETATEKAPWFMIPADDKWFARALIARILKEKISELDIHFPTLSYSENEFMKNAKNELS